MKRGPITTTLKQIREYNPCCSGWISLIRGLGVDVVTAKADETPISLLQTLKNNGVQDAVWALRTFPEHGITKRKFAIACVDAMPGNATHPKCLQTVLVARRYVRGEASESELSDAYLDANHTMECAYYNNVQKGFDQDAAARWTAGWEPGRVAAMAAYYAASAAGSSRGISAALANQAEIFAELFGSWKDGDDGR